jgi:hypothetical protein
MKKIHTFWKKAVSMMMLLSISFLGFAQLNLNGGFETWTNNLPDGWRGTKTNVGDTNIHQNSSAYQGNYACRLVNTGGSHKRFSTQPIAVDSNVQYLITYYVKGHGDIRTGLYDGRSSGGGLSAYNAYHSINATTYQCYTDTVKAMHTLTSGEFLFSLKSTVAADGHLVIDNVTITAVSSAVTEVAAPVITVTGQAISGTYYGPATVSMNTTTDSAAIYYTLDGSVPSDTSTLYTAPFTLSANATVKAIGIKSGLASSSVTTKSLVFSNDTILFFQDFEADTIGSMTTYSVNDSLQLWNVASYSGNHYAYANGFNKGVNEDWLITPQITPQSANGGVSLSFRSATRYNGPAVQLKYSTNYSGTGNPSAATWTDLTASATWSTGNFTWTPSGAVNINATAPLHIAFVYTCDSSNAAAWEIDDIAVVSGISDVVANPVITPAAGFYYDTVNVSISCTTQDAAIYYTLDGTEPDSTSTRYTAPFALTANATVKAIAYKTGSFTSDVTEAAYTFPVAVADIAAFKAANTATNSTVYKITGDVTFVFSNGKNFYIQDATGGLLVYDQSSLLDGTYTEGDIISGGVYGTYTLYRGLTEMVPTRNLAAASGNTGAVTPVMADIASVKNMYAQYESRLVTLTDVTFTDTASYSTASATNINIVQGQDTMQCRNQFKTLEMDINAGFEANVTGFVLRYNNNFQIAPRANSDIEEIITVLDTVAEPVITVNPLTNDMYSVAISCETEGATIYYTTDGTEPTTESTVYTDLVTVASGITVKAMAAKEGMVNSTVATSRPTGIEDMAAEQIRLFPNPTTGILTVNCGNMQVERIDVYSVAGQLIRTAESNACLNTIDLTDAPAGIYFVRITGNNTAIVKKISKR